MCRVHQLCCRNRRLGYSTLCQYLQIPVICLAVDLRLIVVDFLYAGCTIGLGTGKGALPIFLCRAEACEMALFAALEATTRSAVFLLFFIRVGLSHGCRCIHGIWVMRWEALSCWLLTISLAALPSLIWVTPIEVAEGTTPLRQLLPCSAVWLRAAIIAFVRLDF